MDPKRITFNAEVQSVLQSDTGVKVAYLDTKTKKRVEVNADYVVCCLPLNLLAKLEIKVMFEEVLARIPDELSFAEAAPMGCAGVTTCRRSSSRPVRRRSSRRPCAKAT